MLDELMADKDFDMNWNFTDDQVKLSRGDGMKLVV